MATQLQIRRGTSTQVAAFTGAEGEIVVNTTNDSVHVNDGSTAGGFEMARADLNNVSDTSLNAALTGNTVSALTITTLTLGSTAITATGAELNILDGVTATAAELNILDGVTSTAAELNILDGVTSTTAELNILDGVTSTTAELNILDGVTSTTAELNILDGVTATATELNLLDGVTATTAELNYVDGVTSNVQTQLDAKAPIASPTFTGTVTVPGLTTTADVSFGDNDKAIFGAGSDLQIYHSGSASVISDEGTGNLLIQTNGTAIKLNKGASENMLVANVDGSVDLYYDDAKKLATTSTGIEVTGSVGIGRTPRVSLDVAGEVAIAHNATYGLRFYNQPQNNWSSIGNPETSSSAVLVFKAASGEGMRLDGNSNLLVGKTTTAIATAGTFIGVGGNVGLVEITRDGNHPLRLNRTSSDGVILRFDKDGTQVGTISTNANSLPSDRNFKKNIQDLQLGLNFVSSLNPVTYNYKIDDDDAPVMAGLIAQDVEAALASAGVEANSMTLLQHKPTEDDKESNYQMDYLKLVPVLINAIQELTERISQLENN